MISARLEIFREMIERAQSLWLVSHTDGRVLWANEAFLHFIGYSMHEFTRSENPVLWTDITVQDASLEADIAEARSCAAGEKIRYSVRKNYIPKNSSPVYVELDVFRYPITGEFEYFLVEVTPLQNGAAKMARSYQELSTQLLRSVESLTSEIKKQNETPWKKATTWLVDHPKWGFPVVLTVLSLVLGDRFIITIKAISEVMKEFIH